MANYKKKKVKRIKPTKSNHPGKNHRSLTEDVKMQDSRIRRIEKRRRKLKTPNLTFTTKKPKPAKKNKEDVSEYKIIKGNKIKNKFKKILYYISCLFIIVVIICINYMTPTGLVETASNFIAKLGSGYDTAYLQSNKIIDFRNDHGRISVLSDTYLELYNNNSKQMLCYQHGFSTPQLKSSASRILVFDRGGKNFKVFNNSKLLLNESLENTIISADISRSGSIAFVTESTGYLAQVSVYNKGFKNKFTLYSSEKRISDAALNNNGNKIAVCEVLVENGVYSSIVSVYNFSDSKPIFVEKFDNEIITSVINTGSRILAVGNKTIAYFSWNGKHKTIPQLDNSVMKFKVINNKTAVFVTGNTGNLSGSTVSVYNSRGVIVSTFNVDDNIDDISLASDTVWILANNTVKKYSVDGKLNDSPDNLSASPIHICGLKKNSFAFVSQAKLIFYK